MLNLQNHKNIMSENTLVDEAEFFYQMSVEVDEVAVEEVVDSIEL